MGPEVNSASNRNVYQESLGGGGGKVRPACKADNHNTNWEANV
jgi:hypothetical protein